MSVQQEGWACVPSGCIHEAHMYILTQPDQTDTQSTPTSTDSTRGSSCSSFSLERTGSPSETLICSYSKCGSCQQLGSLSLPSSCPWIPFAGIRNISWAPEATARLQLLVVTMSLAQAHTNTHRVDQDYSGPIADPAVLSLLDVHRLYPTQGWLLEVPLPLTPTS